MFLKTHYMEQAEIGDLIALIDRGRIVAGGSPEELRNRVVDGLMLLDTIDNDGAHG